LINDQRTSAQQGLFPPTAICDLPHDFHRHWAYSHHSPNFNA
jgi:hypothetical protein